MTCGIPPNRCGSATHIFLACLVCSLVVSFPTSTGGSGDLCRFCTCSPSTLFCKGVFREGNILERLATEEDLTHLNIARPPTKLSLELFEEHRNISYLDLSQNDIPSLDDNFLLLFRRLLSADLSYNAFKESPKLGNSTESITMRSNMIREIPKDLRYDAPNVSFLMLNENYIKVLHGSHLPQRLTMISLSKNEIIALSQDALEGLNLLRTVDLSYNNISFISSYALVLPSLTSIDLAYNRIVDIQPSALPKGVIILDLSGTSLRNLSHLEGLRSLKILRLRNAYNIDRFTNVPVFQNLRRIQATKVRNSEILSIMLFKSPMLDSLFVTNGQLMDVNTLNHSELILLDLSSNRIGLIGKPFSLPSLELLHLSNNRLTSFPNVSGLLYLRVIDVTGNEIIVLKEDNLLKLPRLNQIRLDHNKIISVDGYYLLGNLQLFSACHNQISDVLPLKLQSVNSLYLDGNDMKTFHIPVIGRISINVLTLDYNELDVIDPASFHGMVVLKKLSIALNKITQILDLPSFPALTCLILDSNPLKLISGNISLSLPSLHTLSLRFTLLTTLPEMIGIFPFMKIIDLHKNALVEFPINIAYNFPNINSLNLNDNMINHLHSGILTSFAELQYLDISNNPIKAFDIDASFPEKLWTLVLGSALTDYISHRVLKSIEKIKTIELQGSRSVSIPGDFFCNTNKVTQWSIDGIKVDSINSTCALPFLPTLAFSNILIERRFLVMMISHRKTMFISNISLTDDGQLDHNNSIVFANKIRILSYINSRLSEVPRILAPSASHLNLSGNHLTTFCFGTMTKFFPSLSILSLSNNRIRVLSSCGMWSGQHPLMALYLDGNHLGMFTHWMCENGLVFLKELRKVDLSNNSISFLSEELIPHSLLKNTYALILHSYRNPHICNCDQRWLIEVKDYVQVLGGQCVAPQDNKGQQISDLMNTDFPCKPMMSDNRICTIAVNNTILVECPALAFPNPIVAWCLQESLEAADHIGLFTSLSGTDSIFRNAGAEQQALELALDDGISGDGAQNILFSLTCLASNVRGSLTIDVSVNITYDLGRAADPSLRGVNQSLSVQCQSTGHTDEGRGCADESADIETGKDVLNLSSRVKIAAHETSGFLTLVCCSLLHVLSKLIIH